MLVNNSQLTQLIKKDMNMFRETRSSFQSNQELAAQHSNLGASAQMLLQPIPVRLPLKIERRSEAEHQQSHTQARKVSIVDDGIKTSHEMLEASNFAAHQFSLMLRPAAPVERAEAENFIVTPNEPVETELAPIFTDSSRMVSAQYHHITNTD